MITRPFAALVSASVAAVACADVQFADSTFEPGSWVQHPAFGGSFEQINDAGNPPPAAHLRGNGFNPGLWFFELAQYDPATSGAVSAVSVNLDAIVVVPNAAFVYLALEQDATVFLPMGVAAIPQLEWESHAATYTLADFASGSAPDWTADGAPFRLGFWYLPFIPPLGDPFTEMDFYIDNVVFTVHNVPEPHSAALLAFAASVLFRCR